jgi:hypothetical protein
MNSIAEIIANLNIIGSLRGKRGRKAGMALKK